MKDQSGPKDPNAMEENASESELVNQGRTQGRVKDQSGPKEQNAMEENESESELVNEGRTQGRVSMQCLSVHRCCMCLPHKI